MPAPRAAPSPSAATPSPIPLALVKFINQHSGTMKVRPDQKIVVTRDWPTPEDRLNGAKALLGQLAKLAGAA